MNKTQIFEDYMAFKEREDKDINGVSPEFAKENPNYEEDNATNIGCWECKDCKDCTKCLACNNCKGCTGCVICTGCVKCDNCFFCESIINGDGWAISALAGLESIEITCTYK